MVKMDGAETRRQRLTEIAIAINKLLNAGRPIMLSVS